MGIKLMWMGWGRGNFCGDGAGVHYRHSLVRTANRPLALVAFCQ